MRRLLPFLVSALLAAPAFGQGVTASPPPEAPRIGLELNRLEARAEGCRVWMVLRNPSGAAVEPLRLDLLVFGKDGVIGRRLALDLGPLPAEKTMARIFDLNGQACDGVGHLLMNDVLACGPAPEDRATCLARLAPSSRVPGVALEK